MRLGSAVSLGIAIVFGILAVLVARAFLPGGEPSPATGRTVVVASGPIPFGAPLTASNLREVQWPHEATPDGVFTSVSEVTGDGRRLALAPLRRNEPILAARITAPNQRATLSTQIDEGMRAVSIRVDEVRGVAGFVLPGDRVDVILTRGEGSAQESSAYADILLQNAKVLAVDQLADDRQDKPAIARAVTLELALAEAQKVVLAQGVGRLSLILRQPGEADARSVSRVTVSDLGVAEPAPSRDRISDLERQLAETRRVAEQAGVRAGQGFTQQMAEIEARLRGEFAQSTGRRPAAQIAAPVAPPTIVNVTRNGAKRESYSVVVER